MKRWKRSRYVAILAVLLTVWTVPLSAVSAGFGHDRQHGQAPAVLDSGDCSHHHTVPGGQSDHDGPCQCLQGCQGAAAVMMGDTRLQVPVAAAFVRRGLFSVLARQPNPPFRPPTV